MTHSSTTGSMTQPSTAGSLARSLALVLLLLAAQAAHATLDAATERRYSGVYSNACSDHGALTVKFYGDVMMVERGGRSVTANRVRAQTAPASGAAPGADFKGRITGEVRGGDGLSFALHHNADGLFAVIEGGAKSLAPLGAGVQGQRLRHCDPNRNALPGAAAAPVAQSPVDLLRDAQFRAAYTKALGPLARERWLARLDGPAPPLRKVTIGGVEYTLAAACKTHDCGDNNMIVLHSPATEAVYGLVQQRGRKTVFGAPPAAVAREIDGLWAREWRGGR